MLDPRLLRADIQSTAKKLLRRGYELDIGEFSKIEVERKQLQVNTEQLQAERNASSKQIGIAKSKGESIDQILKQVSKVGDQLAQLESQLSTIQESYQQLAEQVPNIPDDVVPEGKDESNNQEIRRWGTPRQFDYQPLDHVDLAENLGQLDFETAATITGSRFVVIRGGLARLHRALAQFMLDTHTQQHGYIEVNVPLLVNSESLRGTGQLPKFADDQYLTSGDEQYYLIPTAEVPLTNLVRGKLLSEDQLPLKYVAHTPCFRREAGAYGKDVRGMIRQHQFEKVELVQIVTPDQSEQAHTDLTIHAEAILQKLDIPYRVVNLCGGDLGFSAACTYDLEAWLPGQGQYREISSCSNFGDFQARRLKARFKDPISGKNQLVHTVNGSGLAVGRTLVAVLENYQREDGKIEIPAVLQTYMSGMSILD